MRNIFIKISKNILITLFYTSLFAVYCNGYKNQFISCLVITSRKNITYCFVDIPFACNFVNSNAQAQTNSSDRFHCLSIPIGCVAPDASLYFTFVVYVLELS